VIETRADIGIALDGDADRLIVVDDKGQIVDGDQLMALIATAAARDEKLKGDGIVSTVMSNLGLERFLWGQGIALHRTPVGDRYVVEAMRAGGYNIGGEQSGHIVLADYATTGDGLIAALQVLAALVESGRPAHQLLKLFDPLPQLLKNVRYSGGQPLDDEKVKKIIADAEKELEGNGRLVIRKSGTEPLIRVMAEGEDEARVNDVVDRICDAVRKAA
jgi:phosphoglucosamine mutase